MGKKNKALLKQRELIKLKQGTYADILFILLPFMAILLQSLWSGNAKTILVGPELSIAASILTGLSVSKLFQGLVTDRILRVNKERVVLVISVTIFLVLVPALILTIKLSGSENPPEIVAFVQPSLLVVAITLYISAISIIKSRESASVQEKDGDSIADAGQSAFSARVIKADSKAAGDGEL